MKYIFLLILSIVLFSCEIETTDLTHSKQIENNSAYDLKITFEDGWQIHYDDNEIIIPAGESKYIYHFYKTNNAPLGRGLPSAVESVQIINSTTLQLIKDINVSKNWKYSSFGNRSLTEKCRFIINKNDLATF